MPSAVIVRRSSPDVGAGPGGMAKAIPLGDALRQRERGFPRPAALTQVIVRPTENLHSRVNQD
jgi:hypothetical protein